SAAQATVPIASIQNRCNPYDVHAFEEGIVAKCERDGMAFLPYSPVGGSRDRARLRRDPELKRVGDRHGATREEVALAWLLAKSPVIFPIPGASRISSVESSAG